MEATGVVLAGGQSRRFGRDKLLEPIDGRPMVEHVIERLSSVVDDVLVSISGETGTTNFGAGRMVSDLTPGVGPLGGLQSAFAATDTDWLLVVAGDLPRLSTGSLRALLEKRSPQFNAIVACDQQANVQPLAGCYHRSVSPIVDRCIEEHVFAVKAFISRIKKVEYLTLPSGDLANVNRPEDLETYW